MAKNGPLQAGYGNGGIDTMDQFEKLSDKITNSLKNLEFTRDMIRQLADNEKKSAKTIQQILNPLKQINKNKTLRFSVVDRAIQNYWKKQEQDRRLFAAALQTKIIDGLDEYISSARDRKKKLTKENAKIQRTFIECKKETAKQKQIGLKEWQKLEEQIQKNDQLKKANKLTKIKDLKPAQDRCSKAFAKYEAYVSKLNELEQTNHANACKVGELLHQSQKYAADRLSMHYNIAVSTAKYLNDFIKSNKSIVQSKAPPLTDILWRWLSYPKNHQPHTLPCTSKEVFSKESIGQSFKRRLEPDIQQSPYLKPPKQQQVELQSKEKEKEKEKEKATKEKHHKKKNKKNKKNKKIEPEPEPQPQQNKEPEAQPQPQADDEWNVDFGADDNQDIFATVDDVKQPPVEQKQQVIEKDLVEQYKEDVTATGFDAGFDDNFAVDFGENQDLNIANSNVNVNGGGGDGGGFGGDWNTDFDEQLFADNNNKNNESEVKAQDAQNVDDLFTNDFGDEAADIFDTKDDKNDIFANNQNDFDFDANTKTDAIAVAVHDNDDNNNGDTNVDNGGAGLFDDEFDDEQEITFPEFDVQNNTKTETKAKKKKKKKKKSQREQEPEPEPEPEQEQEPELEISPQPNQMTVIPEPVISFDAAPSSENRKESIDIADDNPFGDINDEDVDGDDGAGDNNEDDIDDDNPFAMFDEPDNDNNDDNEDEFDPFG